MSAQAIAERRPARVSFVVYGLPRPQGSKSAIAVKGRAVVVERGRETLRPWRASVSLAASELVAELLAGPVEVDLTFTLPRPKRHFRSGARAHELREDAPAYVATRPDLDKLIRAVLDALTGVVFADDGQVASLVAAKVFGDRPGVEVSIRELAT